MGRTLAVPEKMKLYLAMLALQCCYAGFHIVSRTALNMGVSKVVFPVYRNIVALLLLGPFAYVLEKKERPPLSSVLPSCLMWIAPFSIYFGTTTMVQPCMHYWSTKVERRGCLYQEGITANQGFYLLGLYYASPTFASAIQNSVPAITFAMAAALRLEQVNITRRDGVAKVVGTIACVGGATIITLCKGPPLLHHSSQHPLGNAVEGSISLSSMKIQNWTLGCLYFLGNCFAWSGWIVLQGPVLRKYPARLSVTSFTCFFGLIQFLAIAAFVEPDTEHWKIHSGGEFLTILYAGLVASGISFSLQIWCIDRGGPLFVAVFQPVQTVLVAIMASLILGDQLYSGGIIGAILIMVGLYSVIWGKTKEKKASKQDKKGESLTKHLLEENSQKDRAAVDDLA